MLSTLVQGNRGDFVDCSYSRHRRHSSDRTTTKDHRSKSCPPLRPKSCETPPRTKSRQQMVQMCSKKEDSFWARFATRTTMHGFADMYLAQGWFAKTFWFLSLIGAIIAVIYYNYVMVLQFLSKPSATLISYNDVQRMQFPNITICSNQILNATFVKNILVFNDTVKYVIRTRYNLTEDDIKSNFISYLMLQLLNFVPFNVTIDHDLIGVMENVYGGLISDPNVKNIFNFFYLAGFDCESFLTECIFSGKRFDCCKFARPIITALGICYQMQFETNKSQGAFQTVEGSDQGFIITTQVNQSCGVQTDVAQRIDYSQEDGIRVHVTDYVSLLDFNPMLIPPNMHATIRMVATRYSVNQDTNQCYDPSNTYKLAYREAYTPNLCKQECASNVSYAKCNCQVPTYYFTGPLETVCSPLQMLTCTFPSVYGDNLTETTELTQSCIEEKCFQTCTYWVYEPNVMYSKIMINPVPPEIETTKLTIYYSQLQYEAVEEELLMNTETFVSNVGGICGLWIGMSLMSIVQSFYILLCGSCEKRERMKAELKEKEKQKEDKYPLPSKIIDDHVAPFYVY